MRFLLSGLFCFFLLSPVLSQTSQTDTQGLVLPVDKKKILINDSTSAASALFLVPVSDKSTIILESDLLFPVDKPKENDLKPKNN